MHSAFKNRLNNSIVCGSDSDKWKSDTKIAEPLRVIRGSHPQ